MKVLVWYTTVIHVQGAEDNILGTDSPETSTGTHNRIDTSISLQPSFYSCVISWNSVRVHYFRDVYLKL